MEPERQIEKLLRAIAKKRRDQSGEALELRPAAREQLQREISRRTASKSGGGFLRFFASLFSGFTPKLAFGLGVLVIAALGAWLLLSVGRKQQPATLAMNESSFGKAAPAARREMVAPPPPASPAPVVAENNPNPALVRQISPAASRPPTIEKNANSAPPPQMALKAEAGEDGKQSVADAEKFKQPADTPGNVAQSTAAPATQAAPVQPENPPSAVFYATPPNGALASAPGLDKDAASNTAEAPSSGFVTNGLVSGATVAAAEPEAQKKLGTPQPQVLFQANRAAVSDGVASFGRAAETASNTQRFRRTVPATPPHASGALSVSPVLTSFQIVQNGQQIRVLDADGSVYTGSFTNPDQTPARVARRDSIGVAPAAASAVKAETRKLPAETYFFRVAGTNLNLNRNVVFSGNLIPQANVPQAQSSAASGVGGGGGGYGPGIPGASLLLNSRIAGKAIIDGGREIEVNATPAP